MRFALAGAVGLAAVFGACGGDPAAPGTGAPPVPPIADAATSDTSTADAGPAYAFDLPPNFPLPRVPLDNPMSEEKVALGRRLFYDKRLSGNGAQSCGSCHEQKRAFTDGRALAVGSTGKNHPRGAQGLANVAYASALTWAHPAMPLLEKQALVPMFGTEPVELGMSGPDAVVARLKGDPIYDDLFRRAFPDTQDPFAFENVPRALAAFERTLLSGWSAYDRYQAGDATAFGASEKRGLDLFFSETLECYHCHGGFLFSDSAVHAGSTFHEAFFHNTGLYNIDGQGAYPDGNRGVLEITTKPSDMGRFRAVSLRNVAVTAPYFHDGSAASLDEVLDHYAAGGRTITSGPHAGNGSASPLKNELVRGFSLSPQDRADVLAFLHSLTDERFLNDPKHADPFATE
jgi:cytochrome c peroxidase